MTLFAGGNAKHLALAESERRLALLERRTPPGYPLGYVLEKTEIVCGGCGRKAESSRLLVINRRGASGKDLRATGASEIVYDLPVETRVVSGGTARCAHCVAELPRSEVPRLPPPGAKLGPGRPKGLEITLEELGL